MKQIKILNRQIKIVLIETVETISEVGELIANFFYLILVSTENVLLIKLITSYYSMINVKKSNSRPPHGLEHPDHTVTLFTECVDKAIVDVMYC